VIAIRHALAATLCLALAGAADERARDPQAITVSAADLLEYYEAGEFDAVHDALTKAARGDLGVVVDALRKGGDAWIDADGPNGRARRRRIAAAFAIEAAAASLDSGWARSRELIDWGAAALAREPAGDTERLFHLAALALCEGARDPVYLDTQLSRMQRRVPGEARVALGRAFASEIVFWDEDMAYWGRADTRRAARPLLAALALPAARDEALLRLAYFSLYAGRPQEALDDLKQIAASTDAGHAYLAALFAGWAHEALRQWPEAAAALRVAHGLVPGSRVAAMHLATALASIGEGDEAARLASRALQAPPDPADPWREYAYGDLRRYPSLVAQLRRTLP
jgi:tetratricopeptide (TPR) repeat protein